MDVDKKRSYSALPHPPCRLTSSLSEPSLTSSYQMNISLQQTLKRVSREVNIRKTGEKDPRQPLPPVRQTNLIVLIVCHYRFMSKWEIA